MFSDFVTLNRNYKETSQTMTESEMNLAPKLEPESEFQVKYHTFFFIPRCVHKLARKYPIDWG